MWKARAMTDCNCFEKLYCTTNTIVLPRCRLRRMRDKSQEEITSAVKSWSVSQLSETKDLYMFGDSNGKTWALQVVMSFVCEIAEPVKIPIDSTKEDDIYFFILKFDAKIISIYILYQALCLSKEKDENFYDSFNTIFFQFFFPFNAYRLHVIYKRFIGNRVVLWRWRRVIDKEHGWPDYRALVKVN